MEAINATPPADFPAQVIVLDKDLARRNPAKAFYLRVQEGSGHVTAVLLESEQTLVGAVASAVCMGYRPTHWMESTDARASELPWPVRAS